MEFSSPTDTADTKAAFRKPSNDAANRKYRRRSPANGSSSSEGSPKCDRNSSPIISRSDPTKPSEHRSRRKDDGKDTDRDAARIQYGRDGDRHSDRQSSRGSHGYSRDEYISHDKHVNDGEKYSERVSSRSGRESRTSSHSEYGRRETDPGRPKDYLSSADKSVRDRYDTSGHKSRDKEKVSSYHEHHRHRDLDTASDRAGSGRRHTSSNLEEIDREKYKRDRDNRDYHYKSSRDSRSDRMPTYEESRVHRNDLSREDGGHRLREGGRREPKEHDSQKLAREGKRYDDWETNRNKDRYKDKADLATENQEKPTKKSRFSNWDKGIDDSEKMSAKQVQEAGGNVAQAHAYANDSEVANDLDAAKVAAMRAAELVNKNLVGVGYMSADQKKKLLWGNKKSAGTEESGSRWDAVLVGDRDRQEKFQKLMSLRLPWYVWPIVGCEGGAEGGAETKQSRSSGEAAGTPARSGEAVHCWTSEKRWPHCRIRSLNNTTEHDGSMFCEFLFYSSSCAGIWILVFLYLSHVWKLVPLYLGFQMLGSKGCPCDSVLYFTISAFIACFFGCTGIPIVGVCDNLKFRKHITHKNQHNNIVQDN